MSDSQTRQLDPATYQIPSVDDSVRSTLIVLFGVPLALLVAIIATGLAGGRSWVQTTAMAGAATFLVGVPWLAVAGITIAIINGRKQRRIWRTHSYTWYRQAFPTCVNGRGDVRCRFCGSGRTTVRNIMRRTYMRLHICSQCGETLYFSPEKT